MKNVLRPILLSQNKEGWDINDILKCINPVPGGHNVEYLMIADSRFDGYTSAHPYYEAQHLYLIDDKAPIKDWYIDDTNQVRKTVISDPNYWDVRPGYNAIICTTDPQLIADGIPSISKEFLKEFTDTQGKGKIMIELTHKKIGRNRIGTTPANEPIEMDSFIEVNKLDKSGNAVLSIVPEETVESFIDGIASHLGMDRKCALDKIDEFSSKLNELKSLQETDIDAIDFFKWVHKYYKEHDSHYEYDIKISSYIHKSNGGVPLRIEQLYEVYKQSKK